MFSKITLLELPWEATINGCSSKKTVLQFCLKSVKNTMKEFDFCKIIGCTPATLLKINLFAGILKEF